MNRNLIMTILGFIIPAFVWKKDYNLVVLRFDNNKFMFNTKVFFEYLLENSKYDIKYIINDDTLREKLQRIYGNHFITLKTPKDIVKVARAGCWLTDGGFPLKTPFGHRNRVLINLWHSTQPLKKMGINGYQGLSRIRMYIQLKMFSQHYNAFLVTSKRFIETFASDFLLDKDKIKVFGQPRMDNLVLYQNKYEVLKKYFSDLPKYENIILYAPTYRSQKYGNYNLEPTKFFPFEDYDFDEINDYLEKNNLIIFLRHHHLDKVDFRETKRIRFLV